MKLKRILAIIGIVILAGLYITTLMFAIFGNENTFNWFLASIITTMVVPVLIWVYTWIYNRLRSDMDDVRKKTGPSGSSPSEDHSDPEK